MKKTHKITLLAIAATFLLLLFMFVLELAFEGDPIERLFFAITRSEAGRTEPDFSADVTDVRITAKERNIGIIPTIFTSKKAREMEYYQVYYGYHSNGEWHDIPAENYTLKAFAGENDYETIYGDHCVRMGDKILLVFPVAPSSTKKALGVIEDTISSKVKVMDEYATASVATFSQNGANCGHVIDGHLYGYYVDATDSFDLFYYIVLDVKTLPKDYQVTVMRCYETTEEDMDEKELYTIHDGEQEKTYTISSKRSYTYEDIIATLNR